MKKTVFFGLLAILLAFSFIGCDDGNGSSSSPQSITYTGVSGDTTYTLKIIENVNRAVYTPQNGDTYQLTAAGKTSSGSVSSVSGTTITLTPSNTSTAFTVTISGDSVISMSGTITWNDDTTVAAPSTLTPNENDNIDPMLNGTWIDKYDLECTFNNGNFEFPYGESDKIGDLGGNRIGFKGIYTTNEGNLTLSTVYFNGIQVALGDIWFTIIDFKEALKNIHGNNIDLEWVDEISIITGTYSVNGNNLTWDIFGEIETLEKK